MKHLFLATSCLLASSLMGAQKTLTSIPEAIVTKNRIEKKAGNPRPLLFKKP